MDFTELAYGTREHRRAPRQQQRESHHHHDNSMGDDIMDLGKMAVGGAVTIGVIGALGSAFNKD